MSASAAGSRTGAWHQRLGVRLAVVLAASVAVILLIAGLAVNIAVTRSFEQLVGEGRTARLELFAESLTELHRERGSLAAAEPLLRRVARTVAGRVEVRDADGVLVAAAGREPPRFAAERHDVPLVDGETRVGSLTLVVPAAAAEGAFLRVFNFSLVLAGVLALAGILGVAALVSQRLTRPLRELGQVAERLGAGDLSARARGGPDGESRELAEAFNQMAERLERSERLRRRAASDMAHELATPVTVLESQLQAMADDVVPADAEQLARARAAAAAVAGVVVELGELSSAEAADSHREVQRFDLRAVVSTASQTVAPLYRDRGVSLTLPAAGETIPVDADPRHVQRALRNVLANAAQYSREGGAVTVELAVVGREAQLRVRDEGTGIAPEDAPHIFERFYRADPARARRGGGTGIGLTIARELQQANGASIALESSSDRGSTFLVRLPLGG